jgi:hypothetical protein
LTLASRLSSVTVLAALLSTGCAAKKTSPVVKPIASSTEGKSSYSYIFDPQNPALSLPADVKFNRPIPRSTKTLPVYPDAALAANDGTHREIVRIVIDTHGNVGQVLDSPVGTSDGGPFAADYRRAVDTAVRTWRFEPGWIGHFGPGPDNDGDGKPDYKVMTTSEQIAVYYDVRFTFEIVNGKGTVRPSD